ncbi:MAG: TlpA disulfide reductase family protein [Holophaga sp.]|nr:TlpA disulfide reductase family protein [Holophaga sp.]
MPRPFAHLGLALALGLGTLTAGPVPPFSLKQLDGSAFRLADHLRKQVIVLDFWATWCGPCTKSLKKLQELHLTCPEVLVLAIAIDDGRTMAEVNPYVQGRGFSFTVLLDPDASVCRVFNPEGGVPYTVVIDRQGSMVYNHSGYLPGDERALFSAVAKSLAR